MVGKLLLFSVMFCTIGCTANREPLVYYNMHIPWEGGYSENVTAYVAENPKEYVTEDEWGEVSKEYSNVLHTKCGEQVREYREEEYCITRKDGE